MKTAKKIVLKKTSKRKRSGYEKTQNTVSDTHQAGCFALADRLNEFTSFSS